MNLLELGYGRKAHGLKGAFSFVLFSGHKTILKKGSVIHLFPYNENSCLCLNGEEYSVATIAMGNKIVVTLKGVNDRETVDKMLPFTIKYPADKFPKTEEGEFYYKDLIGLRVLDHNTKNEIGKVVACGDNSAQTIIEITGEIEITLPFLDHFFPEVNLKEGYLLLILPEMI